MMTNQKCQVITITYDKNFKLVHQHSSISYNMVIAAHIAKTALRETQKITQSFIEIDKGVFQQIVKDDLWNDIEITLLIDLEEE